jgi:hypothetical protein
MCPDTCHFSKVQNPAMSCLTPFAPTGRLPKTGGTYNRDRRDGRASGSATSHQRLITSLALSIAAMRQGTHAMSDGSNGTMMG